MPTSTYRTVFSLAEDQMGYFTTAEARARGVSPMTLVMMAKRGTIERVSRGVYRLADYPILPLAHHMEGVLWPYGERGVLSHETALALYGLSDVNPGQLHITVPMNFRVQRSIPENMVLHFANLTSADIAQFERMPITNPTRTIRDCISTHLGPALIKQAIEEARQTNRISSKVAEDLRQELQLASRPKTVP